MPAKPDVKHHKSAATAKQYLYKAHILRLMLVLVLAAAVLINGVFIINRLSHDSGMTNNSMVLTSLQTGINSAERVSISKVTENNQTDYAFTLPPYETMLIMNISITNLTSGTESLIPVNQFYVRNSEGLYAPMHASMYVTNPLQSTDLKAGRTASGQISFAVPKITAKPLLYVDTNWGNATPIVFDVLH